MIECRKHFAAYFFLRKGILLFLLDEVKGSKKYKIRLSDENFIGSLALITDILTESKILNKKNCYKRIKICANYLDILKFSREADAS